MHHRMRGKMTGTEKFSHSSSQRMIHSAQPSESCVEHQRVAEEVEESDDRLSDRNTMELVLYSSACAAISVKPWVELTMGLLSWLLIHPSWVVMELVFVIHSYTQHGLGPFCYTYIRRSLIIILIRLCQYLELRSRSVIVTLFRTVWHYNLINILLFFLGSRLINRWMGLI